MLDYQNDEFKSLEELQEVAPSIFTKTGSDKTSSKYTHIPTDRVIKDLELLKTGQSKNAELLDMLTELNEKYRFKPNK